MNYDKAIPLGHAATINVYVPEDHDFAMLNLNANTTHLKTTIDLDYMDTRKLQSNARACTKIGTMKTGRITLETRGMAQITISRTSPGLLNVIIHQTNWRQIITDIPDATIQELGKTLQEAHKEATKNE